MSDEPDTPVGALSSVLRRGAALASVALVFVQIISFAQTLVLARLLSPTEVGLFAAGTVLATFLAAFAEGALTQALIRRNGVELSAAADTVFWVTLGAGVCMSLCTLVLAPLVGVVFGDTAAGTIAAVTSGTMVLHALTNVPDALMQRRFDFRRRLIIDPTTALTFAVVAVGFAVMGFGVWALVIGSYAQMAVWVTASWCLAGWRPGRTRPSLRLWREMADFAFPLLLSSVVERIRDVLELVVVGRALDAASLGFYRYGRRIAVLPGTAVVQAGGFVLFPAFSRISGDPERLRNAFLRALTWIWVVSLPTAGLLVASGESLAVLLLGERWRGAGVALTAMAGFGLGQAMNAVTAEAMKGTGRSQRLNWMTGVGLVTGIGLLLLLIPLGLVGVGLAMSGSALAVGLTGLGLVRAVVQVSLVELISRMLPPAVAAAVAVAVTAVVERVVLRADTRSFGVGVGFVLAEGLVLAAVYLAGLRIVAPTLFHDILGTARRMLLGSS